MKYFDEKTGLELGESEKVPLQGAKVAHKEVLSQLERTILSASGWRKVFAQSGAEEDFSAQIGGANAVLAAHMAAAFADFIKGKSGKTAPLVAFGIDSRPTGTEIADVMLRVLEGQGVKTQYLFIAAAPEIMAYARKLDGFVYISASHNPIGHNGVKFGLNDGGVIPGSDANPLAQNFRERCAAPDAVQKASELCAAASPAALDAVYKAASANKAKALEAYRAFTEEVISASADKGAQKAFIAQVRQSAASSPLAVVCDMNGSARACSIDSALFADCGIGFFAINDKPRQIAHAIIPEPENLVWCAEEMTRLQNGTGCAGGKPCREAILGYMPDCDGDRGNIVYWDEARGEAQVLKAQEVFALSVLAELAALDYAGKLGGATKAAVAVNDPTSMRIEEIAAAFGAQVFRAEVGEANVVNLARLKRAEGFAVRILGEGSNGGNITHPAAVRDPVNTIFALVKLLTIRDSAERRGLFHIWCARSKQESLYREGFTLGDVLKTLPAYTTTGVSEARAVAAVAQGDHAKLKAAYQKVFEREWAQRRGELSAKYGFASYEAVCNNGTNETRGVRDFSLSGRGGLKVLFKDASGNAAAFLWMRGSGTEPVFRVMCDIKGDRPRDEAALLEWHTQMLLEADELSRG